MYDFLMLLYFYSKMKILKYIGGTEKCKIGRAHV